MCGQGQGQWGQEWARRGLAQVVSAWQWAGLSGLGVEFCALAPAFPEPCVMLTGRSPSGEYADRPFQCATGASGVQK